MIFTLEDFEAECEDLGTSGRISSVPHELHEGHFPVLVVVMWPHSEQIYFVICAGIYQIREIISSRIFEPEINFVPSE